MSMLVPFGSTGVSVSPLGLGTSHIASLSNPKGDAAMLRLLDAAYDQGIRFFDTADIYGQGDSERLLSSLANRADVVICTKAGLGIGTSQPIVRMVKPILRPLLAKAKPLRQKSSDMRQAQERHDLDPVGLRQRLQRSLKRLNRDHVDVFLLHSPPLDALRDGRLFDLLDQLREDGLARVTGVSVQKLEDTEAVIASGRVGALQIPLSPDSLDTARPALEAANQAGIGVVAREVLSSGGSPEASLSTMLAEPHVAASLVGTTSADHLAQNTAVMRKGHHAS